MATKNCESLDLIKPQRIPLECSKRLHAQQSTWRETVALGREHWVGVGQLASAHTWARVSSSQAEVCKRGRAHGSRRLTAEPCARVVIDSGDCWCGTPGSGDLNCFESPPLRKVRCSSVRESAQEQVPKTRHTNSKTRYLNGNKGFIQEGVKHCLDSKKMIRISKNIYF
jgi:hypothetical protein